MGLVVKIALGVVLGVVLLVAGCGILVAASAPDEADVAAEMERVADELAAAEAAAEAEQREEEQERQMKWEWVADPDCSESFGDSCWQITATAAKDCPDGAYAEMNVKDADGTVIDYANASAGALAAGETALLTFSTSRADAETGTVTEVTCY